MGFFAILPIPFEILDAAIAEKLTYFINGVVEFSREPVTPNSTIYRLHQWQLGEFGEFRIRKLIGGESELFVKDPPRPIKQRSLTDEEKECLDSKSNREEKFKARCEVSEKINKENADLHTRRLKHLHQVANGLIQKLKADPFTWTPDSYQDYLSMDTCIDDFVIHVQSQMRMYFWRAEKENRKHKWVSCPETEAKKMLLNFLGARIGNSALILEEIKVGAGRIDIFIAFSNGEQAIVELKMCGNGYSSNYAIEGLTQIHHYMENRKANLGYLIIFDSRTKDFGKNIPSDEITEKRRIQSKLVDVRPNVK